jgi:hypothetical protein
MTRTELVRRLAEQATRPLSEHARLAALKASQAGDRGVDPGCGDLFVWFEDTAERQRDGRRGIAGLPESLLPYAAGMRVIARVFAQGHSHLLSAVRIRCRDSVGERIAALYTAALSVGTVAWIGTGESYEKAWNDLYSDPPAAPAASEARTQDSSRPA